MPVWIATVVWVGLAWVAPKRLPAHELYAICTFSCGFAFLFDMFVGAALDLYDYGSSKDIDLPDIVQVGIVNPAIALIIMNFMPERTGRRLLYLAGWVIVLFLHELLWLKLGLMKYKGWSIWWSVVSYPFLFITLILNLKLYRRLVAKSFASVKPE